MKYHALKDAKHLGVLYSQINQQFFAISHPYKRVTVGSGSNFKTVFP